MLDEVLSKHHVTLSSCIHLGIWFRVTRCHDTLRPAQNLTEILTDSSSRDLNSSIELIAWSLYIDDHAILPQPRRVSIALQANRSILHVGTLYK